MILWNEFILWEYGYFWKKSLDQMSFITLEMKLKWYQRIIFLRTHSLLYSMLFCFLFITLYIYFIYCIIYYFCYFFPKKLFLCFYFYFFFSFTCWLCWDEICWACFSHCVVWYHPTGGLHCCVVLPLDMSNLWHEFLLSIMTKETNGPLCIRHMYMPHLPPTHTHTHILSLCWNQRERVITKHLI